MIDSSGGGRARISRRGPGVDRGRHRSPHRSPGDRCTDESSGSTGPRGKAIRIRAATCSPSRQPTTPATPPIRVCSPPLPPDGSRFHGQASRSLCRNDKEGLESHRGRSGAASRIAWPVGCARGVCRDELTRDRESRAGARLPALMPCRPDRGRPGSIRLTDRSDLRTGWAVSRGSDSQPNLPRRGTLYGDARQARRCSIE
jgi:hypothetical protein